MTDSQKWLLLAGIAAAVALVYLLAPILTPFVTGALLAYLGDPLVDRLEDRGRSRTMSVVAVFLLIFLTGTLLLLVLLPLMEQQVAWLMGNLPAYIAWVQENLLPRAASLLGLPEGAVPLDTLKVAIKAHWQQAGGVLVSILGDVSKSGLTLLAWLGNLVLIPVVTFYLLRDWDVLMGYIRHLLPRAWEGTVVGLAGDCDRMLSQFFRGQLLVMAALGIIYTAGLWIVGLDLALLIGVVAGVVSFVPYMGLLVGLLLAGTAAFFQFHEFLPLLYVAVVFGVGQLIEGMVLTPLLVGDRIGLHPVAVIFAVLAGGQLFGFLGVLLALPVAAVIAVLLRDLRARYLESEFFQT